MRCPCAVAAYTQLKVLWAIVQLVSVAVVDAFPLVQAAPNHDSHNRSMLQQVVTMVYDCLHRLQQRPVLLGKSVHRNLAVSLSGDGPALPGVVVRTIARLTATCVRAETSWRIMPILRRSSTHFAGCPWQLFTPHLPNPACRPIAAPCSPPSAARCRSARPAGPRLPPPGATRWACSPTGSRG